MDRNEMYEGIMRQAGLSKANIGRFYAGLVALIHKELVRNGLFVLPGVGALRVRTRKARTGRNPQTGQAMHIPSKKVVRLRAYRSLDELINGPRKTGPTDPEAGQAPQPAPPQEL